MNDSERLLTSSDTGLVGIARVRPVSSKRLLARESKAVVDSARATRSDLMGVIRLTSQRKREVHGIDDAGLADVSWERLSPPERKQQLYIALTWLQRAENSMRQTRALLERAIERAERQVG